uniref:Uncharacterized protein n=1 Tax=Glossina pallidipes TaxID=7398 RepID=A0A1B0A7E8_GLOPL
MSTKADQNNEISYDSGQVLIRVLKAVNNHYIGNLDDIDKSSFEIHHKIWNKYRQTSKVNPGEILSVLAVIVVGGDDNDDDDDDDGGSGGAGDICEVVFKFFDKVFPCQSMRHNGEEIANEKSIAPLMKAEVIKKDHNDEEDFDELEDEDVDEDLLSLDSYYSAKY